MKSDHSLNELKMEITKSKSICKDIPIESKHQRLFHLGRELKTGKRTLSGLGIGRISSVIHLVSSQPKGHVLDSRSEPRGGSKRHQSSLQVNLLDASPLQSSIRNRRNRTPSNGGSMSTEVICIDSSDDDDDDDDEVEIVPNHPPKRARSK